MSPEIYEWIGYAASFFIVMSFVVNDIKKVRVINMIGCICFVIYGVYFKFWPVVIPNVILIFVQLYYLMIKDKQKTNA
ncbi:MAG: uroporphyrinogen decarboxylase [Moheibacter sp.]